MELALPSGSASHLFQASGHGGLSGLEGMKSTETVGPSAWQCSRSSLSVTLVP